SLLVSFSAFEHRPPPDTSPLSLHDALPISAMAAPFDSWSLAARKSSRSSLWNSVTFSKRLSSSGESCSPFFSLFPRSSSSWWCRSEEHTSELQSLTNLVCRLLLEKKTERWH